MEREEHNRNDDLPRKFGKYQLVERLAVGGMAEIFRAKTTGIGGFEKTLVIKRLHDRLSRDDEFIDMIVDEARIAVRLNHPNIGKVFDLGRIRDQYYIAMEYIQGPDLGRVVELLTRRGDLLPIPAALFVGGECCSGLHYAHTMTDDEGRRLDIVHRDISPPNIMLSVEGEVKIVDFGIAKARKRIHQTERGTIKGKFHYMAPEQAHGSRVDARTDVFSVGMVMYELLAGRHPYEDVPESEMVDAARAADIPPLRQYRPKLDPELSQMIMQALQADPDDRYRSAADFDRALTDYRERKCEPYDRRRLSELVSDLWSEMSPQGGTHAKPAEETGSMTPYEFEADESSIIHETGEAEFHGEGRLEESETAPEEFDEEAPTTVWEGEGEPGPERGGEHHPPDVSRDAPSPEVGGEQHAPEVATGQPAADPGRDQPAPSAGNNHPQPGARSAQPRSEGAVPNGAGRDDSEEVGLDEESLPPPPEDEPAFQPAEPEPEEPEPDPFEPDDPERPGERPPEPDANRAGRSAQKRDTTDAAAERDKGTTTVGAVIARLERAGIDRRMQIVAVSVFSLMLVSFVGLVVLAVWPSSNETKTIGSSGESGAETEQGAPTAEGAASLRVESSPPGAEVRIDGEVRGEAPTTVEGLNGEKTYEVELRREDYQVETREVTPSEQSEPLDVKLESSDGVLKISSYPSDAEILLDGESVGYAPVTAANIRRGESHRVVARLDGDEVEREVTWEEGDEPVKEIQLEFEDREEADREERAAREEKRAGSGGRRGSRTARAESGSRGRGSSSRSGSRSGSDSQSSDDSTEELNLFGDSEESSEAEGSGRGASASESSSQGSSEGGGSESSDDDSEDLDIWGSGGGEESSGSSGSSDSGGKGYLSVQVKKGWGKVYVDGQEVASETPLMKHSLEPGSYKVKVYYPVLKRSSEVRTVQVEPGKTKRVIFDP